MRPPKLTPLELRILEDRDDAGSGGRRRIGKPHRIALERDAPLIGCDDTYTKVLHACR